MRKTSLDLCLENVRYLLPRLEMEEVREDIVESNPNWNVCTRRFKIAYLNALESEISKYIN